MNALRPAIAKLVESPGFQGAVLCLIVLNAIILGAETFDFVENAFGPLLILSDRIIIYAFIVEICLRFYADPGGYFKKGWNIFDFLIVFVSLVAATSGLAAWYLISC